MHHSSQEHNESNSVLRSIDKFFVAAIFLLYDIPKIWIVLIMLSEDSSNLFLSFYTTLFSDSGQFSTERVDLRVSVPSTGSTLNWKTEHDSKYTPIVFTQDFRYFERDMNADIL